MTMTTNAKITMDSTVCPACAVAIPKRNTGCPHCHYSFANNARGRVGTLREMLASEVDQFNNVSPAFLRLVAQAATAA
jgi:ribosomal protein L37AE/L43A